MSIGSHLPVGTQCAEKRPESGTDCCPVERPTETIVVFGTLNGTFHTTAMYSIPTCDDRGGGGGLAMIHAFGRKAESKNQKYGQRIILSEMMHLVRRLVDDGGRYRKGIRLLSGHWTDLRSRHYETPSKHERCRDRKHVDRQTALVKDAIRLVWWNRQLSSDAQLGEVHCDLRYLWAASCEGRCIRDRFLCENRRLCDVEWIVQMRGLPSAFGGGIMHRRFPFSLLLHCMYMRNATHVYEWKGVLRYTKGENSECPRPNQCNSPQARFKISMSPLNSSLAK